MESGQELILMALASGHYDRTVRRWACAPPPRASPTRLNVDLSLSPASFAGSLSRIPSGGRTRRCGWAGGQVKTMDGVDVDISVQTICLPRRHPGRQHIVRAVREALDRAGCQVKPAARFSAKPTASPDGGPRLSTPSGLDA